MKKGNTIKMVIFAGCVIVLTISLFAILFLRFWPAFGGRASTEDQLDYAVRAENFREGKFFNGEDFQITYKVDGPDPNTISQKGTVPQEELPSKVPTYNDPHRDDELRVTWFGHSSLLLQMHGMNLLIDPVFSECPSPVSFIGSKRFSHPPIQVEELPHIDVLLLSHDHYDHLDYDTIRRLDGKVDRYIVPLGVENHLKRWAVASEKIQNMAWWEETQVNGLTIACAPAMHYSGRSLDDQFTTLWASWVFKDEYHQIYESGDSGYGGHYQDIHNRYGDFDFVLIDCAQYDVTWPQVHMFPEQAVEAVEILGAKSAMPIHWGAFKLSNHGWDDPPERFTTAGEERNIQILTPQIGETMSIAQPEQYMQRWWRDLS